MLRQRHSHQADICSAFSSRAHVLDELGRFDEALASCDKALNLNPGNAEFHASRANILGRMRRHHDALRSLRHSHYGPIALPFITITEIY